MTLTTRFFRGLPLIALAVTFVISGLELPSESSAQGILNKARMRRCPKCETEVCELKREMGKETRTCFKVDYRTICIPKVTFPWQDCCEPKCGEARSVKFLTVHTYECPACQYEWEVVPCPNPGCAGCAGGVGCDVPIAPAGQTGIQNGNTMQNNNVWSRPTISSGPVIGNGIPGNQAQIIMQPGIRPQQPPTNYIVPSVPTRPTTIQNDYWSNPRK